MATLESESWSRGVDDELYAAIEERFRGHPDEIRKRQRRYVERVSHGSSDGVVLDLGSGRGEWLDVLREAGVPARGVDENSVFVGRCRERGLDVVEGDLVEHLRSTPDSSIGAVTLFQVAEHLTLAVLRGVLYEAHRVLTPGGVLIVEIPNAETLRVGASTFWIDPTHSRPIFPEFLVLLVERAGFGTVERDYSTPLEHDLDHPDPMVARLARRIDGPGDVAIIATK